MDDLGNFATALLAVITLGTAAGVGFQRGKIGRLRGELNETHSKSDRLSGEVTELRADNGRLRADLEALSRVVTGEVHWTAIGLQLDEHHTDSVSHWERHEALLKRMAEIVETYRR